MRRGLGLLCAVLLFLVIAYGGVAYQVRRTVFSADFAFAEIDQADPVRAMKSTLLEHLPVDASPVLIAAIDAALDEQRPWLVGELRNAVGAVQDYLRGAEDRIQVLIDPTPLRAAVVDNVTRAVQAGAGAELQQLPMAGREAFEAEARRVSSDAFAALGTFRFDSAALSPARQVQLASMRSWLALFDRPLLIVLCAVVALAFLAGVFGQLHLAGVAALAAGVVLLVPTMFAANLVGLLPLPALSSLPGAVAAYLPTFAEHLLAPLRPVAMAAMVVGVGMLGLSLVVPMGRTSRGRRRRSRL